jgi:hypothetical protein
VSLSPSTASVVAALAEAFVPSAAEGGPPLAPGDPRVLANVETAIANLPWDERVGCRFLLRAVRWLPLVLGPRRGRLDRLAVNDRRETLVRLARSRLRPLRFLFFCLKSVVVMAYYARPEAWPAIGYDGPYLGRIEVAVLDPPPLASGPLPQAPPPPRVGGRK